MALPKPQNPLDWLTQLWNIACGQRIRPDSEAWLLGPIGSIGGISDRYIDDLAARENLSIERNPPSAGLVDRFSGFDFPEDRVHPQIRDFYCRTLDYDFDVWTEWKPVFGSLGYLVYKLFSQRIEQLNLPQRPLDTAWGMKSEIIYLRRAGGQVAYRIWFRRLKRTGEVVYSGIYSHCILPNGSKCLKIIFPLPEGSATVIMRPSLSIDGNLTLESRGRKHGDPGFYFLVRDRKGNVWRHYLPSFHEAISVYIDSEATLRADHTMSLWGCQAFGLHYKIRHATRHTPPTGPSSKSEPPPVQGTP